MFCKSLEVNSNQRGAWSSRCFFLVILWCSAFFGFSQNAFVSGFSNSPSVSSTVGQLSVLHTRQSSKDIHHGVQISLGSSLLIPERFDIDYFVYPNPTMDFFLVNGKEEAPLVIEIYDANAQILRRYFTRVHAEIHHNLPGGHYQLRFLDLRGELMNVQSLIIIR